ncbi:MAG: DUF5776 domain-containing protein [Levilactobacillus sp.]|uniref:DUF5776 domain-containing protein n=1 Tax=Levilactobacillus sp. TaxID=2767919 RepID=UPI00258C8E59|nr:DUF5776 domain-containing protein [Levilactobacillus sp.]MCI1553056.1 DUF5776 domain-containing protein [Levilactobacillus sp.]MCI1598197.1 DUF5776 domain-containing protein [Levilactobacillus sp.]MCI1605060.1 DUF5776 domain-containing protein [Levilactobacillus sp.]
MKRRCVIYLQISLMAILLIATFWLVCPTTVGHADTAADINPVTQKPITFSDQLDDLLPQGDSNADIVRAALEQYNIRNKYGQERYVKISGEPLAFLAEDSYSIYIDQPMTDYTPLLRIARGLSGLHLYNQPALKSTDIATITNAMMSHRQTSRGEVVSFPAEIDFSKNNLGNSEFTTFVHTVQSNIDVMTFRSILKLGFAQNRVTDFSPYLTYKQALLSESENQQFSAANLTLAAHFQQGHGSIRLPDTSAVKLVGNTLTVPFAAFPENKIQMQQDPNQEVPTVIGYRVDHGESDYFDDPQNVQTHVAANRYQKSQEGVAQDQDGFEESYGLVVDPEHPILELGSNDLTLVNQLDAQQRVTKYTTRLSTGELDDLKQLVQSYPGYFTGALSDLDTLRITNVPAGSTSVKVRVLYFAVPVSNSPLSSVFSYAQTYQIPIPKKTTGNAGASGEATAPQPHPVAPQPDAVTSRPAKVTQKLVWSTRKIGLYRRPTFMTKNRLRWYQKQPRIKRPMFKVIGYARSKHGVLRYRVREVTPGTAGRKGYITARKAFVDRAYYQTTAKKIKVLKGLNGYRTTDHLGKRAHYKKGQILRVKRLVKCKLTARYQLTNGQYVSAAKRLVLKVK